MTDWHPREARSVPVETGCIWCKQEPEDPIQIGDNEEICHPCRDDLREFKRSRQVDILIAADLEPIVQRLLISHWQDIKRGIASEYPDDEALQILPPRTSNAGQYVESIPTRD